MKYIAPIRSRLISLRAVARIPIFDRGYPNLIGTAQSTVFSDRLLLPLVFLLFFIVEVALQFFGGAFSSEFGGHPDEAAHYVTGLMVRDYIAAFQPVSPMRFAENYYLHYPKVALGHWPPFFYVVQSAWTLLFSPSRVSVLLLMALLTTLLAVTVHLAIRSEFGPKAGIAVGLLLLALPLTQIYSKMIMAEILVALLNFCAVLCFGRFLNSEKWGDAGAFGICAGLAILTKGNGLVLAFVPPLALLFSRRFHLLARPAFWCPAVIVLVFCGPVHWLTMDLIRNTWQEQAPSLTFTIAAIPYYSYHLAKVGGIGFSLLAAIGFVARIIRPGQGRRGVDGKWAAAGALLLSVWGFHFVVPVSLEARHLIPVVPALLMFLVAGIAWAAERLPLRRFTAERKAVILALAVALIFGVETFAIHKKAWYGFGKVAQQLLSTPDFQSSVFLVSSDPPGEGMFISEVAMRERRPGHVVLRASKVLSASRWDGSEYKALYSTPEEMMRYLAEVPVGIVVIDLSIPMKYQVEDHRLLKETLAAYPQRWERLGTYPLTRQALEYPEELRSLTWQTTAHPDVLWIYRLVGHESQPVEKIRVDMDRMLNRTLELPKK